MSLIVAGGTVAGSRVDLRITAGTITELGPFLQRASGEEVLDATGCQVLPGLWDHHLHLRALAAAATSIAVGPPRVTDARGFALALRSAASRLAMAPGSAPRVPGSATPAPGSAPRVPGSATPAPGWAIPAGAGAGCGIVPAGAAPDGGSGWVRAVGYHESVAGPLDRRSLDELVPGVAVRVQHRSGALWVVNSAGADVLGLDRLDLPGIERDAAGRPTGRLFRMDAWLSERLPVMPLDLGEVSAGLARCGVTGFTEATPDATADSLGDLVGCAEAGQIVQRLHLMCPPGVPVPVHPLVTRGPRKVLLDDDRLPPFPELVALVEATHAEGSPVAIHCVTEVQLAVALGAIRSAGVLAGDRIEHAALVPPDAIGTLAELGVTVVTNPSFVHERGDAYRVDVPRAHQGDLYRCASLLAGGVKLAAGTDAPFASADPWPAMEAATTRRTRSGEVLGSAEAVMPSAARALFCGRPRSPATPRRVAAGEPGDLCLARLPGPGAPWRGDEVVEATVVAGKVVHRRG